MKKFLFFLALVSLVSTSLAQDVHAITYLDVPRSQAAEFVRLHQQFVNHSQGADRTVQSEWLMAHTFGGNYSFVIVDVYESIEDQVADKPLKTLSENIEIMDLSEAERATLNEEFSRYFNLYLEGHSDEVRQVIDPEDMFYLSEDFDATSRQLLVINRFNPKWSDRKEFLALWKQENMDAEVARGHAVAVFTTGHYSGTSATVHINTWYPSWDAFVAEEKALDANRTQPMSDDLKRMWDLGGSHSDEILSLVGTNWNSDRFVLSK
ncbi:MAG: hypothetical protein QGH06_02800 [Lutibacter sp.]|nr:hypothetical protein [Lutibacter sp.]